MKRLLSACSAAFALALAAAPSLAQTPPAAAAQEFRLSNGMTLIVKPDSRAPTAVHMVWLRVGSMDEVDGTSGVAHALEHMMFKGTEQLKPGEFSRRVAAMGGSENAFTYYDYTGYYQQIPVGRLEDVMQLEADRFAHNHWPDDEFTREIAVIKEERRMRTDDQPRARLIEALNAMTFMAAPYRRPVIGWMGDLDSMTADDVRDFHRRWYVPANAAVVVAGDVDPQAVRALAERSYGAIPAGPVPVRKPRDEPEQKGIRRLELKAPAEQSYLAMAWKVPRLERLEDGGDALALTVLAAVLDGYPGARLERALTQGPDRVADSAGASNGLTGRGPQLFMLDGVPAPGKTPEQLEAALRAQIVRVAREGVSAAELERVKTQWVAGQVYRRDSLFNQARELGSQWVDGFAPDFSDRLIERLRQVTAEQVQAVAARYFGDDQLNVAVLRPQPPDPAARDAARKAAPAGLRH
ncbi:M16 family metallopeptidase [Pseudorhodoferax sp.]|uniref:M16 family metallopeptidase n=1 Tax=Pseudorhodoferax sp. TaxID=1993553 RepID=UPI0039E34D32